MRSFFLRACTGLTFCTLLLPCTLAVAGDDTALGHAKRARIAYELRDWATAIGEYRSAYVAEHKADHLFGLAQALRQSHDYAAAIYTFKAYKRLEGVSPRQASAADLLIAKCEAEVAAARAEAAPLPAQVEAPLSTDHESSDTRARRLSPVPAPDPPPTKTAIARPMAFYEDVLGDSLFIVGLAGTAVGAGLLIGGNSEMDDVPAAPTDGRASAAADSAQQQQLTGAILLPVGGALIAGAIWRWVSVAEETLEESGSISLGPHYIEYSGRF